MTTFWKMTRTLINGCLFLLLLSPLMGGCTVTHRDETRIAEAAAKADAARYAAMEAQARTDAQIGVAREQTQAEIVREQEKTTRETAWLSILPWLLGIVILGGGVVASVLLVLWWQGRLRLAQTEAQTTAIVLAGQRQPWQVYRPQDQQARQPDTALVPRPVTRRARETGTKAVPDGDCWLLVDVGGEVVEVMERKA